MFKRQVCLSCERVLIYDFSIEINNKETRRHKQVGVKMENELKFNSDAKHVENNYSRYMSWNIFYFITCKVTAVMIAIWSWKYKISPFGVFFFFFFLNYWLTLRGDRLVEKTMIINQQFFCVEAIFHRCCKFISFLEIFGNLSLYSKLSAIISNILGDTSQRESTPENTVQSTAIWKLQNVSR